MFAGAAPCGHSEAGFDEFTRVKQWDTDHEMDHAREGEGGSGGLPLVDSKIHRSRCRIRLPAEGDRLVDRRGWDGFRCPGLRTGTPRRRRFIRLHSQEIWTSGPRAWTVG